MAVTTYGHVCTRLGSDSSSTSSHNVTLATDPTSGDVIVIGLFRSTGNNSNSPYDAMTSSGFTLLVNHAPAGSYDMFGSILYKESNGTETGAITISSGGDAGEPDSVIFGWVFGGGDPATITSDLDDGSVTSPTYPTATLDKTVHIIMSQSNVNVGTDFPTGDTDVTGSTVDWRNGAIATAGGNTSSGTFSSASCTWGNVSISEATATVIVPTFRYT